MSKFIIEKVVMSLVLIMSAQDPAVEAKRKEIDPRILMQTDEAIEKRRREDRPEMDPKEQRTERGSREDATVGVGPRRRT